MNLIQKAREIREQIFTFKTSTQKGHVGTSLSCVDILVSLFYDEGTNFDHTKDILIFGKGHGSPSVYPILADLDYFPIEELDKYCTEEGILRMHSDPTIPGCHFVGGSLGNALGYCSGLAYGNPNINVYCILGDAECYEGSIWESLFFSSQHNINNLITIVDRNGFGTISATEDDLKLDPLDLKFASFGFEVFDIDGHNFAELNASLSYNGDQPIIIIANTDKGKGVSYMENNWIYHVKIPDTPELIEQGLRELRG